MRVRQFLAASVSAACMTVMLTGVASAGVPSMPEPLPAPAPQVLVVDASPPPVSPSAADYALAKKAIAVQANVVGGLTVANTHGKPVTVVTAGQKPRVASAKGNRPVVFRGLTVGKKYAVTVAGRKAGVGVPVAQVGPAFGLTVTTTPVDGQVQLSWRHTVTRGEGTVTYLVVATPVAGTPGAADASRLEERTTVMGDMMMIGMDVRYGFTVTPTNTAGSGRVTAGAMLKPLREMSGASAGTTVPEATPSPSPSVSAKPEPAPGPGPGPAPGPGPGPKPSPSPSTKVIWVCPDGYPETADGVCEKTTPYTYATQSYTYHSEAYTAYGPPYVVRTGEIAPGPTCAPGWSPAWDTDPVRGSVNPHCEQTRQDPYTAYRDVRDDTPAGWTDNGSEWVKRNPIPSGWTDNGTEWVKTVPKVEKTVPV